MAELQQMWPERRRGGKAADGTGVSRLPGKFNSLLFVSFGNRFQVPAACEVLVCVLTGQVVSKNSSHASLSSSSFFFLFFDAQIKPPIVSLCKRASQSSKAWGREEKTDKKIPRLLSGAPVYSILLLRVFSDAELQD